MMPAKVALAPACPVRRCRAHAGMDRRVPSNAPVMAPATVRARVMARPTVGMAPTGPGMALTGLATGLMGRMPTTERTTGAADADGGMDDGLPIEVSWSDDIVPFLYDKCGADNDACHSRVAYNAVLDKGCLSWASFEDVLLGAVNNSGPEEGTPTGCEDLPLDQRLINRSPWQCGAFQNNPTELLIVPFSSDDSYIVKKMEGTLICDDTVAMPPPNLPPMGQDEPITITYAEIQMVRDWIDAGAVID